MAGVRDGKGNAAGRGGRLTSKVIASAVEALCERDDDLSIIVKRHGPPPVRLRKPGFETLAQIIVEQQVTLASGQAIWRRGHRGGPSPHGFCGTATSRR